LAPSTSLNQPIEVETSVNKIIIIGAGPAGSTLALRLIQLGMDPGDITVVERRELTHGHLHPSKVCGEGLGNSGIAMLISLGIPDSLFTEFQSIRGIRIASPGGIVIHAAYIPGKGGKIIPRDALDGLLATQVRKAGACVLDGQEAKEIHRGNDHWIVSLASGREVKGDLLIGADGATSRVARVSDPQTGYKRDPRSIWAAIRGYAEGLDLGGPQIWMNFLSGLPGYAWAFPSRDKANIGVWTRLTDLRRYARKNGLTPKEALESLLHGFCDELINAGVARKIEIEGLGAWPIPVGPWFRPCVGKGLLLVGDATGGVASPLTGGGIANSITSAFLAAEVIALAYQKGDFSSVSLKPYERMLRKALSLKLLKELIVERMLENERIFDMGAKILSSRPELMRRVLGA